ncbi:glycosyltransferase [Bacteroidota bacterium]
MKIGIIIPCYNIEQDINLSHVLCLIDLNSHLHFCFVNNASSDNTMSILEYLKKESTQEVSVLDIKKNKPYSMAVRLGARYLNTIEYLDYVQSLSVDFNMSLQALKNMFERNVLKEYEFYENNIY